jgi:hypothetical protein
MGTENSPYESLLGVIAPIIDANSIQDVKNKLYELIELYLIFI